MVANDKPEEVNEVEQEKREVKIAHLLGFIKDASKALQETPRVQEKNIRALKEILVRLEKAKTKATMLQGREVDAYVNKIAGVLNKTLNDYAAINEKLSKKAQTQLNNIKQKIHKEQDPVSVSPRKPR